MNLYPTALGVVVRAVHALMIWAGVLAVPDSEAEGLARTAPTYLSAASARERIVAAHLAAEETGTDENLLLSIAWHESRYTPKVVSNEPGGMVSCGEMTPEPISKCPSDSTLLSEYRAGSRHLRTWMDAAKGDLRVALTGYAGGYWLISGCAKGPVWRERANGHKDDICGTADVFLARARWIERERRRRSAS